MRRLDFLVYWGNMRLVRSEGTQAKRLCLPATLRQCKLLKFVLGLVVFLGMIAVPVVVAAQTAEGTADAVGGVFNSIAPALTYILLNVLLPLMGRLLTLLISVLVWVSGYSDFINSTAVVNGWVIVRDIANMFFIIVLLIVAFGTILGQEQYHYKKLLPKLLIMAVLINFSRTIVGVMIDAAQVVMLTFVNGYSAAAGGNFAAALQIKELLQFSSEKCEKFGGNALGESQILIGATLALGMVVVSIITVTVILAVLLLRIVVLWFLTVMSPMAFLLGTFPQGQKYYTQWWEEFQNQVIVGPVLAFFLWLSLVTVGSGNAYLQVTNSVAGAPTTIEDSKFPAAACTEVGGANGITSFAIATLMLLAGTQMAQQMGGAIAGVAGQAKGIAKKGLKLFAAPLALGARFGLQRGERGLLDFATKPSTGLEALIRRPFKYLTPTGWKGFTQRGKGLLEESRKIASAEAEEESNYLFTGGKRRLPLREAAEHGLVGQYAKDFSFLSKEGVMRKAAELETLGGTEGERARAAIISVAAHGGYLDDIMRLPEIRKKLVALGKKKHGYTDGTFYNKQLLNDFLWDYMTGAGVGTGKGVEKAQQDTDRWQFQARMLTALEEPGKTTGHWEYLGHARYNPATGKYEVASKKWMQEYGRDEYNKKGDAARAEAAPHNFLALRQTGDGEEDADTYGTIGKSEMEMMTALTPALMKEARRLQGRHAEWVLKTKLMDDPDKDRREKGLRMIMGDEKMGEFAENLNTINSDYLFGLYSRRTGVELRDAIKGKSFKIVDKDGTLIREIKYAGPIVHEEGESGGHAEGGGHAGGSSGGGEHKMTPSEALQASTLIQTAIKPQLTAMMRDIEKPDFLDNQALYREMRKLMKDLAKEIGTLEDDLGVKIGDVRDKLDALEGALPGEGASSAAIRAELKKQGKSEESLRKDIADIAKGIGHEFKESKESKK